MRAAILIALLVSTVTLAGCTSEISEIDDLGYNEVDWASAETAFEPHVLVAIPDTGINPYHDLYFRPERTNHPCTYVEDFPCDIPALPLSVGIYDEWEAAYEADASLWVNLTRTVNAAIAAEEPAPFFWIPQTVFVAVSCDGSNVLDNLCLLDDQHMHGTGTTASVIMENPDALLAFRSHSSNSQPFLDAELPVDIFSVSWGYTNPRPDATGLLCYDLPNATTQQVFIKSSGNSLVGSPSPGASAYADCWSGNPYLVSVGGAYAEDNSHETGSSRDMDVVSYFCRPVAQTREVSEIRESYCGTSFSAPTVAGALSKVLLAVRESTGYTGGIRDGMMDPEFGLTKDALVEAMYLTASYEPESQYPNQGGECVTVQGQAMPCAPSDPPLNPAAPWLQWGWGFYDGWVADATIDYILNGAAAPEKPGAAEYMAANHEARQQLYG